MSDIGPNDLVECVKVDRLLPGLSLGGIYRVASIKRRTSGGGYWYCAECGTVTVDQVLDLVEFPVVPDLAYCTCCFKPVFRGEGQRTLIEDLLQSTRELEPV